jgi:hypothetical protein
MPAGSGTVPSADLGRSNVARVAHRVGRTLGRLDALAGRIRPWMVLAPLVIASWLVMLGVGIAAKHDGWIYYHGGDGTWYYTTAWVLGHGHIPASNIGYGYPILIAPLAAIGGPSMLAGMPLVVLFNAIVLAPIALLCIYGLARAFGGRRFAYAASLLWVFVPVLAIADFYGRYHGRYVDQTIPAVIGLTPLGDYPTMVLLLVATYFAFRAISYRSDFDALVSGLAAGFALAVKPANLIFLPAPLLALAVARRPREIMLFAGGLIPSLLGLALWKYRGLGYIPAFSNPPAALAAGVSTVAPVGSLNLNINHYLHFSWGRLTHNIDGIREFTWSLRLLMWLIIAGLIGLARRSLPAAILIGGWFTTYLLLKGSTGVADIYGGGFFRYLSPAFPAVFLLAVSVPFLVPVWGRRLAARRDAPGWPATHRSRRALLVVAGAVSVLPLIVFVAFRPLTSPVTTRMPLSDLFVPVGQFPLHATTSGRTITLSWPRQTGHGARILYSVFRGLSPACKLPPHGAIDCVYPPDAATGTIAGNTWIATPGPGHWQYQIGVLASPLGDPTNGDYVLLSQIASVDVPG